MERTRAFCGIRRYQFLREFLAEVLGTFMLMIFGIGSVAQAVLSRGQTGSAMSIHWSWGLGVTFGIYVSGGVSGGHMNPSVSVAQACIGRFPWRKVPLYALAQYLGSFVASVVVYFIYTDALENFDGGNRSVVGVNATAGIWSTYPQPHVSTWNGLGDQIFGTAILLICVLAVTDKHNAKTASGLVPISIGLSVFAIGMTFGYNCGYAINPARDLAPRIFTLIAGWGTDPFSFRDYNWFWVPVVGPHVGAVCGALIYQIMVGLHWPDVYVVNEELNDVKPNKDNRHIKEGHANTTSTSTTTDISVTTTTSSATGSVATTCAGPSF